MCTGAEEEEAAEEDAKAEGPGSEGTAKVEPAEVPVEGWAAGEAPTEVGMAMEGGPTEEPAEDGRAEGMPAEEAATNGGAAAERTEENDPETEELTTGGPMLTRLAKGDSAKGGPGKLVPGNE